MLAAMTGLSSSIVGFTSAALGPDSTQNLNPCALQEAGDVVARIRDEILAREQAKTLRAIAEGVAS